MSLHYWIRFLLDALGASFVLEDFFTTTSTTAPKNDDC